MAVFAAFGLNMLLARVLDPASYGAYFIAVSLVTAAATVGLLGMDHSAVRLVSEALSRGQLRLMRWTVRTVLCVAAAGGAMVALVFLSIERPLFTTLLKVEVLRPVAWVVALWTVGAVLQRAVAEVFRGLRRIELATLFGGIKNAGILVSFGLPLAAWLLHSAGRSSLESMVTASALVTVLIAMTAVAVLRQVLKYVEPDLVTGDTAEDEEERSVDAVLRLAAPLMAVSVLVSMRTNLDVWLVGIYESNAEVAIYGAASRLVALAFMPLLVMNSALAPLMAKADRLGGRKQLERTVRVSATAAGLPALAVSAVLALFASSFLDLAFGGFYRAAGPLLLWLLAGQLFNVLAGPNMLVLMMRGEQVAASWGMLVTVAYVAAAGVILAPRLGSVGVALASASGLVLQNLLMSGLVQRRLRLRTGVYLSPRAAWSALNELRVSGSEASR